MQGAWFRLRMKVRLQSHWVLDLEPSRVLCVVTRVLFAMLLLVGLVFGLGACLSRCPWHRHHRPWLRLLQVDTSVPYFLVAALHRPGPGAWFVYLVQQTPCE